jgi:hypothetical protein
VVFLNGQSAMKRAFVQCTQRLHRHSSWDAQTIQGGPSDASGATGSTLAPVDMPEQAVKLHDYDQWQAG